MLVKGVDNKGVVQISEEIHDAGKEGNNTHKKRLGPLKILPSFLIVITYYMSIFLSSQHSHMESISPERPAKRRIIMHDYHLSEKFLVNQYMLLLFRQHRAMDTPYSQQGDAKTQPWWRVRSKMRR